jgi:hydroxymethylbilane synthase
MGKTLTVATRRGELALAQTQMVIAALRAQHPGVEVRIHEMVTAGDRDRRTALWDLKDTGFFTSHLEEALLAGEADFAVHSLKDLPTQEREGLAVTAVYDRRWPEDCLLARKAVSALEELPPSAQVGTSSLRRAAQLRHLRPDVQLVPLRGNVQTRLRKLETTGLDAVILARAGLERLGLAGRISFIFDPTRFIPAAAQGALAIQTRRDDEPTVAVVRSIDDEGSRAVSLAERQVLVTMKCGCHAPVGAYAQCRDGTMEIHAFICDIEGRCMIRRRTAGPVSQAIQLGAEMARELLDAGGREILRELEREQGKGELRT